MNHNKDEPGNKYYGLMPWVGNKTPLLRRIMELVPQRIDTFVEVFGGSAALTLAIPKRRGVRYVLNDFNHNLTNLYRCVREKPWQLAHELRRFYLNSQADFSLYLHLLDPDTIKTKQEKEEVDQFKRLALTRDVDKNELLAAQQLGLSENEQKEIEASLVRRAQNFDVKTAALFAINQLISFGSGGSSFGGKPVSFQNFARSILANASRLERVIVRNCSYADIFGYYAKTGAFLYCDPPYHTTEDCYTVGFTDDDHRKLHELALQAPEGCYVAISYNDDAFIRALYSEPRFHVLAFDRHNTQSKKENAVFHELIILNYDPDKVCEKVQQISLFDM